MCQIVSQEVWSGDGSERESEREGGGSGAWEPVDSGAVACQCAVLADTSSINGSQFKGQSYPVNGDAVTCKKCCNSGLVTGSENQIEARNM